MNDMVRLFNKRRILIVIQVSWLMITSSYRLVPLHKRGVSLLFTYTYTLDRVLNVPIEHVLGVP